jgi:hypothetical protein
LVGELADRLGFTAALSAAMAPEVQRRRRHDPGVVLTHLALMLVDGGDCVSDLATLSNQPTLFGAVASEPTAARALGSTIALDALIAARRDARERAWAAGMAPRSLTIDIDATLVETYSRKEWASATYKGGFGFHPMFAFLDETDEALVGLLRPGNAGSNDAADHLQVLDEAIEQLPASYGAGHGQGDDPADVAFSVLVRTDAGGASHAFVEGALARNCEISVGFYMDRLAKDALLIAQEEDWVSAREADGSGREGAFVTELTHLADLSRWGEGLRLIARRERPLPGVQLSLFDQGLKFRHSCFLTNSAGEVADLELRHRGHARVEDRIKAAKDMGLANFPSADRSTNETWLELVVCAMDLVAWTKALCLDGDLARAEPKRLRYALLHTAGRLVRSGRRIQVRLQRSWPWSDDLAVAFRRVQALGSG